MSDRFAAFDTWFAGRGWAPFDFQREVWAALANGGSGLLHATTGAGKTYAVALGALAHAQTLGQPLAGGKPVPLGVLWLTPMRALAADSERALGLALADLAPAWRLGRRTSDTSAAERARQDKRLPTLLITTPESLSLLLTRADAAERLGGVHTVVVDEWHEQVGNKRGVQVQLALARLVQWRRQQSQPQGRALAVWGLSATLGNLPDAMAMLVGGYGQSPGRPAPRLVQGRIAKGLVIDTLLPSNPGRFSWAGHLGAQMQRPVAEEIERTAAAVGPEGGSTLVFTNVRSQAEAWYQMLLAQRPDWAGEIALHHGSLDKSVRAWVEAGLKAGTLKAVVATSSLDLGVDFVPVARVLQIGSAKGVARLLQRAGRSGHQPGRISRITLVPTNTLELIEAVAARRAVAAGRVEARQAPEHPLDVLVQHLVTVALGGGFQADALYQEVRLAYSDRALSREAFQWALDFVLRGGESLGAYPEYHRVVERDGLFRVEDRGIALRHRLQVGTIVGESAMLVKWLSGSGGGKTIGQVEESFIARLNPGDCFVFAGRVLEYVRTHEMSALVRKAKGRRGVVPSWSGGKMALSSELADATLAVLHGAAQQAHAPGPDAALADARSASADPELQAAAPMLAAQARLSQLPLPGRLLVEQFNSREGHHLFIYPFAGRLVHLGLASLLAWRLAQAQPNTYSISVNDYGFELLAAEPLDLAALHNGQVFAAGPGLLADVLASLNSSALARKRFREISRVAGLVFPGYPGAPKSTRQLQASSSLFLTSFANTTPAIACCTRPTPRCWRKSWIWASRRPAWAGYMPSSSAWFSCKRRARLRWP